MKTVTTISLAALLALACNYPSKAYAQSNSQVNIIRAQYLAINKRAPRTRKVTRQLSGFSLEGGQLVAYFDGRSIIKMIATHYGEMGRSSEEYYYLDGKLIFVFEKILHYNQPMGKVVRSSENRYYFKNDELIRWIDPNGKQADTKSEDSRSKQKDLLGNSNLFTAGARSKEATIERS